MAMTSPVLLAPMQRRGYGYDERRLWAAIGKHDSAAEPPRPRSYSKREFVTGPLRSAPRHPSFCRVEAQALCRPKAVAITAFAGHPPSHTLLLPQPSKQPSNKRPISQKLAVLRQSAPQTGIALAK